MVGLLLASYGEKGKEKGREDFLGKLPYLLVVNLFIIVFGGGGSRRGGCSSGCLFWIIVSVGLTIFINLILLLISLLISGPGPGVNI